MNIYVAGNYREDRYQVKSIADVLESHGHTVTFKWWEVVLPKTQKAIRDLDGVARADALVVLMEKFRNYRGTWCEVGGALIRGIPVYFIGNCHSDLVFRNHPLCHDFRTKFPDADSLNI